jgi:hypothetical protein
MEVYSDVCPYLQMVDNFNLGRQRDILTYHQPWDLPDGQVRPSGSRGERGDGIVHVITYVSIPLLSEFFLFLFLESIIVRLGVQNPM